MVRPFEPVRLAGNPAGKSAGLGRMRTLQREIWNDDIIENSEIGHRTRDATFAFFPSPGDRNRNGFTVVRSGSRSWWTSASARDGLISG